MFVQLASNACHGDGVPGKSKSVRGELRFRLNHSIPYFFCAARFCDDDDERLRESLPYSFKHAVKTLRVGVVEEKDVHWIVSRARRS